MHIMRLASWIVGGIILGFIIHIVSVLILPSLAQNDAWARLSRYAGYNSLHVLPAATPEIEAIADMDPSIRYAICRYDLDAGPLKIVAKIPQTYWSLAIYDTKGSNFYSLNDRSAGRNSLTLWIASQSQILALEPEDPEESVDRLVVKSHDRYGIAILRILIPEMSYETVARVTFASSSCIIDDSIILVDEQGHDGN